MSKKKEGLSISQVSNGYEVSHHDDCSNENLCVFQSKKGLLSYIEKHFSFENKENIDNDKN